MKKTGIFADKTAIVTGGASGIGRAVSEELARRGATVILADVNTQLLEETEKSIKEAGFKAKAATLDVTEFEAVKNLVDETVSEHGRLDYIFNNAGVVVSGYAHEYSYDDWRRVIDVNLYGVVNGVHAAYPVMVKQGFGHIVNTGSLAGLIPVGMEISYVASKFGVVGLSHALRVEAADQGVKVSVVCPGFIKTPIFDTAKLIKLDREKIIEAVPKSMPVEKCARIILRGVERNKTTIVVAGWEKYVRLIYRISPDLMLWILRLDMKKTFRDARIEQ